MRVYIIQDFRSENNPKSTRNRAHSLCTRTKRTSRVCTEKQQSQPVLCDNNNTVKTRLDRPGGFRNMRATLPVFEWPNSNSAFKSQAFLWTISRSTPHPCNHVLVKNFYSFKGPNPGGPFRRNAVAVKVSRYRIILNYVFTRYLIVYLQQSRCFRTF